MLYSQPNHIQFIKKSAIGIIKNAIRSLDATNGGIETFPISGYLLHSLFLKLTGAQEQKLKCICWELACRNYEYRFDRYERKRYGECSSYDDKVLVFKDLLNEIEKLDVDFAVTHDIKSEIICDWRTFTEQAFEKSLLAQNFKRNYNEYKNLIANIDCDWIMKDTQLFVNKKNIKESKLSSTCGLGLQELYNDYVYKERNRSAHNTRSYQHNLPSVNEMLSPTRSLQNYFLYLSIIILLDVIYIKLFNVYMEKLI